MLARLHPLAVRFALGSLALLAWPDVARAQGELAWWRTYNSWTTGGYPTYSTDVALAAAFDSDGAVYLTGYVIGPVTTSPPVDPLTVKYLPNGDLAWARCYDLDPDDERGGAIGVDAGDGSVYVATSTSDAASEVTLIKYDAAGNLLWSSTPYTGPGPGPDTVTAPAIAVDSAGNVYLGVTSTGTTLDAVVLSYDASGSLRWETRIDGPAGLGDRAVELTIDRFDGLRLGAVLDSTHASALYGPSCAVAALSASGAIAWTATFPATGTQNRPLDLDVDAQGASYALLDDAPDRIVKLDAAGAQVWSSPTPEPAVAYAAIAVDALGQATAVGTDGFPLFNGDLRVIHLRADGAFDWSSSWNGPTGHFDEATDVAVDWTGAITVVGRTLAYQSQTLQTFTKFVVQRYAPHGARLWTYQHTFGWSAGPTDVFPRGDGSVVVAGSIGHPGASQPPLSQSDFFALKLEEDFQRLCVADGSYGACPCGNASAPGTNAGCANSAGTAARTDRAGSASLAADTLALTTSGELPTALSIVLQGQTVIAPIAFGDGLRCVGGGLLRLYVENAAGGVVTVPGAGDPTISAASAALGEPLAAGFVRSYQVYYRDPDLGFCGAPAGASWNASSGVRVTWSN